MFFDGVSSLNELKTAYYKLVMVHHPDRGGDVAVMQRINAEHDEMFSRLKNAQNVQAKTDSDVKETTETPEEFREIVQLLLSLEGVEVELCGAWLWLSGDTYPHKDALKAAGCRWSRSKQRWYWRHEEKGCHWSRGKCSMVDIREKYGSKVLVSNQKKQLQSA